ncbi:MAG: glycoside hydrolase family 17, partial [Rhodanobacter sp.]
RWLRAGWLFALAYYGLLLAVDGRYRDFPLGLFWLPCLGYALLGWLGERRAATMPSPEERFLALWPLPLALAVLVQEAGLTAVAWLWLGLNLLLVLPVLVEWCRGRRLAGLQTRPVGQ